ncbi:MAG TPA: tripartite tricarboxylate transporter substrate binding protein [Eoetvoesiella sp.]
MKKNSCLLLGLASILLTVSSPNVLASSTYPDRPIKLVVPFTPGGSTDFTARLIGQKLSERIGQSIVIENKPGAGGAIGASYAAKSAADGYTLFAGHVGTLSINPALYKRLSYEPATDFKPVAAMVTAPLVIVVNPKTDITTVAQLIEKATKAEHGLTFSTAGAGSAAHLASELFVSMTGIPATHVPYKGASDATNAVVAGDVDFTFGGQAPSQPLITANRLRALAITAEKRSPRDMSLAVVAETVKGYEVQNWHGIVAPSAVPAEIINYLNKEINAILEMPEVRDTLVKHGYDTTPMSPAAFAQLIDKDRAKWKGVIDKAGLALD